MYAAKDPIGRQVALEGPRRTARGGCAVPRPLLAADRAGQQGYTTRDRADDRLRRGGRPFCGWRSNSSTALICERSSSARARSSRDTRSHSSGKSQRRSTPLMRPASSIATSSRGTSSSTATWRTCATRLARNVSSVSSLTSERKFIRTIDYVPPEQIQGSALDRRADIYSLGCLLFGVSQPSARSRPRAT